MNSKPRKRYTTEFKAQAVELLSTGKPVPELAEELCVSSNLLYNWRPARRARRSGAQDYEPQASGPQRTTCGLCDVNLPALRWKMTF